VEKQNTVWQDKVTAVIVAMFFAVLIIGAAAVVTNLVFWIRG
jgi:hypothetical protein